MKDNPRRQQCSSKQTKNKAKHPTSPSQRQNNTGKRNRLRQTTIWAARPRGFSIPLILRRAMQTSSSSSSSHLRTIKSQHQRPSKKRKMKRLVHKRRLNRGKSKRHAMEPVTPRTLCSMLPSSTKSAESKRSHDNLTSRKKRREDPGRKKNEVKKKQDNPVKRTLLKKRRAQTNTLQNAGASRGLQ